MYSLGGHTGTKSMIYRRDGRPKHGNHGVANIFVERSAFLLHDIGASRQIFIHQFNQWTRPQHFGES